MLIRTGRQFSLILTCLLCFFGSVAQGTGQTRDLLAPYIGSVSHDVRPNTLIKTASADPVHSDNWSGYEVHGGAGSVTDVVGSWTLPAVTCPSSGSSQSSVWVGIDNGLSKSQALAQIGTESDCNNGKTRYYAWYEFRPLEKVNQFVPIMVDANDQISAEVSFDPDGDSYTVTIQDGTGAPWSEVQIIADAPGATAEWVVEAPGITENCVQPLANFGTVNFTQAFATIADQTEPAGSIANRSAIIMEGDGKYCTPLDMVEAVPSPPQLTKGQSDFSVIWEGPPTIYSFYSLPMSGSNLTGANPNSDLIQDDAGNLYGTATYGGAYGYGAIFELTPPTQSGGVWTETVLYNFCPGGAPCLDGQYPTAGLFRDSMGNLYGTTPFGGANAGLEGDGGGTVFELATSGQETVLYSFCTAVGCADGSTPDGDLIQDAEGNLYGNTGSGGANFSGAVFELAPPAQQGGAWTEQTIYSFCSVPNCADGASPSGGLVQDATGSLYGVTMSEGANSRQDSKQIGSISNYGTVFKLMPPAQQGSTWTEETIYSFCSEANCTDGNLPVGGLIRDAAGNLYGTTSQGGANNMASGGAGTVFMVSAAGLETVLYNFCSMNACLDGETPYTRVLEDAAGNLYGSTLNGGLPDPTCGLQGCGTLFELSPPGKQATTWSASTLYLFCSASNSNSNCIDGYSPEAGLIEDSAGNLYTTTFWGGGNGEGTVFKFATGGLPALATTTTLTSSPNPTIYGQGVTFAAVVSSSAGAPPPNGETVSFISKGIVLGTATLVDGSANLTISTLSVGMHSITADYAGDLNFGPSQSTAVKQVVNK